MKHGITEEEWNDYLEGIADDATRDRLEAHLIGCLTCWEFHEQMAHATSALRSTGRNLRAELVLSNQQLHTGIERVFTKLNATEEVEPTLVRSTAGESIQKQPIQDRLDALAALLAPMCGPQTAFQALRTAAIGSPARCLEQVSPENWTPFLTQLTSIATVMCGETGAHLVWESGQW